MNHRPAAVRVLVCEDSRTYARSLAAFLGCSGELDVIAVCASGEEAVEAVPRVAPDLVAMDLELPGMGGVRAIEEIMRRDPVPIVVLSAHVGRGSEKIAAALAAGAVEVLPKGQLRLGEPEGAAAVALRHRLRRLARARVGRSRSVRVSAPVLPCLSQRATVVGICASTGGPGALATILADLPATFPLPVLVVQHMARGFIDALVRWLDERVPLPVAVVRHETPLQRGVWFAPDDAHLVLAPSRRLGLDRQTANGSHHPSADVLLRSMATVAGPSAIAVVLSGMGRDGGRGVAELSRAGGCVIAQDEETSVVFGMPRTAIEQGAQVVLPLAQIASALRQLTAEEVVA